MNKKVIIISGATATGKTGLSLKLAQHFKQIELINFDSLSFYRELKIGTARPTHEIEGFKHHFFGSHSVLTALNASQFEKQALPLIGEIHNRGNIPLLVGGSGFYLQALLYGMYESPTLDKEVQARSELLFQKEGIEPFIKVLQQHDPVNFEKLHVNDHYRIRRAVEHFWQHQTPFSLVAKELEERKRGDNSRGWQLLHFYLKIDKQVHWSLIERRTLQMVEAGLIEETKNVLALPDVSGQEKPLQSIGYKQVQEFLRGDYSSKDELIEKVYFATRRLAKAQKTWFASVVEKQEVDPLADQQSTIDKTRKFLLDQ